MFKKFSALVLVLGVFCLSFVPNGIAGEVIDRIQERGSLVVGISGNQPPLNMTTKDGEVIGLDANLAEIMAMAMDVDLKVEVLEFKNLMPALEQGKVDMVISGMTMTSKRNLKVAFVGPYFASGKGILTKRSIAPTLGTMEQLNAVDVRLVALGGSTSKSFVQNLLPDARHKFVSKFDDAIKLLLDDEADALVADFAFCVYAALRYEDKGLVTNDQPFGYEPLGVALPPEDTLFINWAQNVLTSLEISGETARLAAMWFADGSWINELPE